MISPRIPLINAFLLLPGLVLNGCGQESSSPSGGDSQASGGATTSVNHHPSAQITALEDLVPGQATSLDGSGSSDPDGDSLSYHWMQTEGPALAISGDNEPTLSFTVPTVTQATQYTFELTVNDGALSSNASISFQLTPPDDNGGNNGSGGSTNQKPTAIIAGLSNCLSGQSVTVDGSASSDPDGDTLSYLWTQVSGPSLSFSDASSQTPSFVAPMVTQPQQITLQLSVSDGALSNSASVSFLLSPVVDNTAPSITSSTPQADQDGVAPATTISISFDEALLQSSVDAQAIQLTQNSTPVAGSVSYDSTTHTLTYQPDSELGGGLTYTISVGQTLKDLAGNAFGGASWSFTTALCATAAEYNSLSVSCPGGQVIQDVTFASYGTPGGSCGAFSKSTCDASNSLSVVSSACKGLDSCTIDASNSVFGDPCSGQGKQLSVQVSCATSTNPDPAPTPDPVAECEAYTWPAYSPDLNYDFRNEFTNIDPAQFQVYQGCDSSLIAGVKSSGWFSFIWGHDRNPSITDTDIDRVLANLNEDMAFARNELGWPPDLLPREGYYSNVYLFGSGLCTDNASNTEKGGWQSGINGYPMVLLSYYPVITASERGGITHEAIHAVLASMPGSKAAWFNEGGNTWLQMNMEASRTGNYGVGFLDGAPFLAPHIPIENYSGWLQDGSFGGPDAEGVNRTVNGQQISTWRDYLGGHQYNSVFSHFLAEHVSKGANAWLWSNGNSRYVLQTLASGLGDEQVRHLVMEYRARQAMVDFGPWNDAFKREIDANWGRTIGAEEIAGGILQEPTPHRLTFYADSSTSGDLVTPSQDTLPGWSGANQIPFTVSGNRVRIGFTPLADNMRLQLAYRASDGSIVYSQPVSSGEACLNLDKTPKDGTVVAITSNVDYLYKGEETRTKKHDYRLNMIEGVSGTASIYEKHYQ